MKNARRALKYFRADAPRVSAVFLLMLGSIALNVLKPWPLAVILDSVLATPVTPDSDPRPLFLIAWSVTILVIYVGQGGFSALQNYLSIQIGLRGLTRVRNELFAKLQQLSLRFHHGSNSGDLIYRASWDTYAFQTLFQQGLVTFTTALLSLIVMTFIMVKLNLHLTIVALCLAPLLVVAIKFFSKRMSERTTAAQQADSKVTSFVQQSIAAMQLIQSYTRERHGKTEFEMRTVHAEQKRMAQHASELLYGFEVTVIFAIGTAVMTWLGANEVSKGNLSIGQLIVFLAYLAQLYEPLNQLSHVGATVAGASAGTKRVFEILDALEEVKDSPNARALQKFTAHSSRVTFENVSFGYEKGRDILREVSFALEPGESVALIGPSGAGKTTLLNLLPRFFDPTSGAIKLDGVDLRELKLKDLRSNIALVLQQPVVLPGTIAENIAYGKCEASLVEIEAAARAANAHEFIEALPKKYQTVVGDGAARLSIGEQQRINLARAFLKDAPILLLDEPTSALDADNERLVLEGLQKLMKGRTTLVVAHRLRTIRNVDRILVLENGKISQSGTAEELARYGGYFARAMAAVS